MTRPYRTYLAVLLCVCAALAACARGGVSGGEATKPPQTASPETPARLCPACAIDATRYLRQLSFDLRGRPPSLEELQAVERAGDVPAEMIEQMLRSEDFLAQVRAWHEALLWPTLDGFHVRAAPLVAESYDPKTGKRVVGNYSPDPALLDDPPSPTKGAAAAARKGETAKRTGYVFLGDTGPVKLLRGGNTPTGCDPSLEYPPPAPAGKAQPTYAVTGSDKKRRTYAYYDADGVPLPYHDAAHCPNYCSSKRDDERAARGYAPRREDFSAMNAPGADESPHELDPPGKHCPDAFPIRVVNTCSNAPAKDDAENLVRERREGYRRMKHYWSGRTVLRTCAYEAQERTTNVRTGESCAGATLREPSCGCGPEGIYCTPAVGLSTAVASRAEHLTREALNEEPLRIVASVVGGDEDYFEIFRTRRSFVNGPEAALLKKQLGALTGIEIGAPAPPEAIPNVPYEDLTFHEYLRDPEHAGVLTTAAYLGRFPTWRARVAQFRAAFMCKPFTPGSASLPSPDDPCTREPNLARRCGCKSCHSAIEPMSAWFGRWAERSTKYLSPDEYPAKDPYCQQCALTGAGCTPRCRTQYVVSTIDADGARYAGTLRGYLYRTPEEERRIEEGPRGLVASAIASGELPRCTVSTVRARLLGRGTGDDEADAPPPALLARFEASRHNYRDLVRAVVTSPEYRTIDGASGGRGPRRLGVDQLRAALVGATGFTWVASRTVFDPDSPQGVTKLPDADMLEALAATLGRPDYVTSTHEGLDPGVTFTKLAGDAARSACRAAIAADVEGKGEKRILRFAGPNDTATGGAAAIRQNLAYLALRFWGRHVAPEGDALAPLLRLFERASAAPGNASEGWRAVCIAMATDPQFLTY